VTCVIWLEAWQMKKQWSAIPNKLNVKGWNQKKIQSHKIKNEGEDRNKNKIRGYQ